MKKAKEKSVKAWLKQAAKKTTLNVQVDNYASKQMKLAAKTLGLTPDQIVERSLFETTCWGRPWLKLLRPMERLEWECGQVEAKAVMYSELEARDQWLGIGVGKGKFYRYQNDKLVPRTARQSMLDLLEAFGGEGWEGTVDGEMMWAREMSKHLTNT